MTLKEFHGVCCAITVTACTLIHLITEDFVPLIQLAACFGIEL